MLLLKSRGLPKVFYFAARLYNRLVVNERLHYSRQPLTPFILPSTVADQILPDLDKRMRNAAAGAVLVHTIAN